MPSGCPTLGRNWGKINVPMLSRRALEERMSPIGQGLPEGPPDQRQRPNCERKISAQLQGSQPLGGKHCWSGRSERL
jgi:hypothetical protein